MAQLKHDQGLAGGAREPLPLIPVNYRERASMRFAILLLVELLGIERIRGRRNAGEDRERNYGRHDRLHDRSP